MDAAAWNARYAAADEDLVWAVEPNLFVAAELSEDPLPPGIALDLGCGEGRHAVWLATRGWRVRAVDFAAEGVAKGRSLASRAAVDIDWVVADVVTDEPQAPVDLVLVAYLHLPWAEMATVLGRGVDALGPGGTLLAVGHHVDNVDHGVGGPQDVTVLHDHARMAAWADDRDDVDVVRAARVERPVGAAVALDSVVRLRRR